MRSALLLFLAGLTVFAQTPQSWRATLEERLPLYGHRNWIVVADSAYPL
ncbi:MAG: hypothetical protein KGN84_21400 [Acidobacteriota bacterium]|nr:hypothetical protein [Acidobacteriota bacterium]